MNDRRNFRWGKWLIVLAAATIVVGVGLRLALLDGWLRTVRIDGPSMAPTLCGTHRAVACGDCGISFRVDGEHLPESGRLVCPNCGFRQIDAARQPLHAGDTVLVDRWPLLARMPRRWEVVAYNDPHEPGAAVKRVAGLPGETISIRDGDLYVSDRIVRKSIGEFWQTAVLVHDDAHRPRSQPDNGKPHSLRWVPSAENSGWQADDGGYRFDPHGDTTADRLQYVHWRCDASLTERDEPAAILDNDAYNQAVPRQLNEVHDLVLSCSARLPADGDLTVEIESRGIWRQVQLDGGRQAISASAGGKTLATATWPQNLSGRSFQLVVGQFDAQISAAIDGQPVLRTPLDESPTSDEVAGVHPRIRISAASAVWIGNVKVWRDIYLLEPRGTRRPWMANEPLAKDQFFVLGDNVPVSIDSRHWKQGGISRRQIRGIVLGPQRSGP